MSGAERPTPRPTPDGAVPTVAWWDGPGGAGGRLELLDQTRLPREQVAFRCEDVDAVCDAIRRLVVRGAPAIGVAAAHGLVLAAQSAVRLRMKKGAEDGVRPQGDGADPPLTFNEAVMRAVERAPDAGDSRDVAELQDAAARLRAARPTAVNLAWAVNRCLAAAEGGRSLLSRLRLLKHEARAIHREDEAACAAMGRHGASLLREGGTYLTHCNTGRLATAGIGTAFGVFATAQAWGLHPTVYVGEVRPLLQGSRLTAFELRERGIEGRLLPDTAAASLLRSGRIDAVLVGADRIAANGDFANKIGTYGLAEVARANGVPFYVVAPTSTIDRATPDGASIPIEERDPSEVLAVGGVPTAPPGFPAWNPAFDVTPAGLVSAIVTERGIFEPPYRSALSI